MKLSGNVLDIIRVKTDEFSSTFAYSCPGMQNIWAQRYLEFDSNFDEMFWI